MPAPVPEPAPIAAEHVATSPDAAPKLSALTLTADESAALVAAVRRARALRATIAAKDDLLLIIGQEEHVNGQISEVAEGLLRLREREWRIPGERPTPEIALSVLRAEVDSLLGTVEELPNQFDLFDLLGRRRAAGTMVLHVWSSEQVRVPAAAARAWQARREAVLRMANAF